jgi:hypothetical protein
MGETAAALCRQHKFTESETGRRIFAKSGALTMTLSSGTDEAAPPERSILAPGAPATCIAS